MVLKENFKTTNAKPNNTNKAEINQLVFIKKLAVKPHTFMVCGYTATTKKSA